MEKTVVQGDSNAVKAIDCTDDPIQLRTGVAELLAVAYGIDVN